MYLKMYNPDPKDFKCRVQDTIVVIPPREFVIVSEVVGSYIQEHNPVLEVKEATEEQYKEFRLAKETKLAEVKKAELKLGAKVGKKVTKTK
jgi:hypothetical protein